jgi:precorrin-2 dehydrogenase/sirohydrochlorin ferrochelatase
MNNLFPIFLKLENLHTLIVGGGYVGLEKITAVLDNSPLARVTLVSPEIREEIMDIATANSRINLIVRKFEDGDLLEKDLVIVATNDKAENRRIREICPCPAYTGECGRYAGYLRLLPLLGSQKG